MGNGQPVRVKTPLGEDLLFHTLGLTEELGRLFECELELLSPKEDIELDDVLGEEMTVEIDLPSRETRYLHGWVSDMAQTGRHGGYAAYTVVLRPWLWFLTRTADCRIFQEMTVPEILKEVLRDNGFSEFDDMLTGDYRTWEYCVQYRETDFNFLSRLMEQEGIYYFFEHEDGKDTLVLADAPSCHSSLPGYERIPYYPPSENVVREEHVYDWRLSRSVQPGTYGLSAFHFKKPRANLEVYKSIKRAHSRSEYEIFDYPGEHYESSEGDTYVGARIEELQAKYERVRGETDAMGLYPGGLFELEGYPRTDQNREYLITAARHSLSLGDYGSGARAAGMEYSCSFEALDNQSQFRAERITPKPFVQGPQTAIVSGPSGEEIHTDEFGRVKVQFRWDRYGASDENSSCWVRVAQVWAGTQWGGMTIPRIGQEVIVDFIEGDPDRPIITGRVYNNDNMPPYALPDNKTQSGIKSRSSKGGGPDNFNEIRFEDKIGEEEMYVHAEKNQNVVVENDQSVAVENDQTILVENNRDKRVEVDQNEHVGNNKKINVIMNHTETVGANFDLSVGGSKSESVTSNSAETISIAKALSIGAAYQVTVGGAMNETVGAAKMSEVGGALSETVGALRSVSVAGNSSEDVGGKKAVNVGKDRADQVAGKHSAVVKEEFELKAKKIQLTAEDEVIVKAGKAQIIMKKSGDIEISGANINVKGSGKMDLKASKDLALKGSKIKEN